MADTIFAHAAIVAEEGGNTWTLLIEGRRVAVLSPSTPQGVGLDNALTDPERGTQEITATCWGSATVLQTDLQDLDSVFATTEGLLRLRVCRQVDTAQPCLVHEYLWPFGKDANARRDNELPPLSTASKGAASAWSPNANVDLHEAEDGRLRAPRRVRLSPGAKVTQASFHRVLFEATEAMPFPRMRAMAIERDLCNPQPVPLALTPPKPPPVAAGNALGSPSPFLVPGPSSGGPFGPIAPAQPPTLLVPAPTEEELEGRALLAILRGVLAGGGLYRPGPLYPEVSGILSGAGVKVTPEVASAMLENVAGGSPPFRPSLGKGGCSWFISEGNPFTSTGAASSVAIDVQVSRGTPVVFGEAELSKIHAEELAKIDDAALQASFRERANIPATKPLNSRQRNSLAALKDRIAESRMWDRVGELTRNSADGVGEVVLTNSAFSRSADGKLLVVAKAQRIFPANGVRSIVEGMEKAGLTADATVAAAAEALFKKMKWAGRVRGAFRVGGRVLLVVGIAVDVYTIIVAHDHLKAVLTVAGGWAGAAAAGTLFATWWTPADTAGPVAWAVHGVGTLAAGGIGYFVGSSVTQYVYEMVLDETWGAPGLATP